MNVMQTRYIFLASFTNLRIVGVTSYAICGYDLYYSLNENGNSKHCNTFKSVHQVGHCATSQWRRAGSNITADVFRTLYKFDFDRTRGTEHIPMDGNFVLQFAKQLRNIKKLSQKTSGSTTLNTLIAWLPHIQTMSISQVRFKHLPVEIRKVVRTLLSIRQTKTMKDDNVVLQ